jgi:hypothetical protein
MAAEKEQKVPSVYDLIAGVSNSMYRRATFQRKYALLAAVYLKKSFCGANLQEKLST